MIRYLGPVSNSVSGGTANLGFVVKPGMSIVGLYCILTSASTVFLTNQLTVYVVAYSDQIQRGFERMIGGLVSNAAGDYVLIGGSFPGVLHAGGNNFTLTIRLHGWESGIALTGQSLVGNLVGVGTSLVIDDA